MNEHRETEGLAGASDTTGDPLAMRVASQAVEVKPMVFYGKNDVPFEDEHLYDFAPKTEEEPIGLEDVDADDLEAGGDPKDSSAPASALSELYRQFQTPLPVQTVAESSSDLATPADADKGSTTDAESKTGSDAGSQTSKQSQTS